MATRTRRVLGRMAAAWAAIFFIGAGFLVLADCASFGLPFTDLGSTSFCAQIAEAYYTGLSNGTSSTTYSPTQNVPREQMAAFVTRTLDQSLLRGSRRAALAQWWNSTPHFDIGGLTFVGAGPALLQSDGADIWGTDTTGGTVDRVRASDGKLLGSWTGATNPEGVLVAMGRVFVTGFSTPGNLYELDPSAATGPIGIATSSLGNGPIGIAFDGDSIWTANNGGSVSIVTPSIITPGTWTVTTVPTGFTNPIGALFDGTYIWVTDQGDNTLKRLFANGSIAQSVPVGQNPTYPVFDGHNIWVPNNVDNSLTVVRASDGTILKTFSAGNGDQNGLSAPLTAAFDGQRVLVTNNSGGVSLFKATDLSPIGSYATHGVSQPYGACSDGSSFWVSFHASSAIGRY